MKAMEQNVSHVIVMGRKGDDPHSANKDILADEDDNDIYLSGAVLRICLFLMWNGKIMTEMPIDVLV